MKLLLLLLVLFSTVKISVLYQENSSPMNHMVYICAELHFLINFLQTFYWQQRKNLQCHILKLVTFIWQMSILQFHIQLKHSFCSKISSGSRNLQSNILQVKDSHGKCHILHFHIQLKLQFLHKQYEVP